METIREKQVSSSLSRQEAAAVLRAYGILIGEDPRDARDVLQEYQLKGSIPPVETDAATLRVIVDRAQAGF